VFELMKINRVILIIPVNSFKHFIFQWRSEVLRAVYRRR